MPDIELRLSFRRLLSSQRELGRAGPDLKRRLRRALRELGRVAQRAFRAQFAGRLTDPVTRRRRDRSARVGRFSGRARGAIGIRIRIRRDSFRVFIGPRGGAGIPGPGFYLAFHEFGSKTHPRRATAAIADRLTRPAVRRELAAVVARILPGW